MVVWCLYCSLPVAKHSSLLCLKCEGYVHFGCMLQEKPSRFEGDVLFDFQCKNCGGNEGEQISRSKLTWLQAIHITLYNLSVKGSGRQGFFRWKDDICPFISKNWNMLFPDKPMTNNWRSTVAGTLSVYCSKLFKSGQSIFKESGWWALMEVKPPLRTYGDEIKVKQKSKQKVSSLKGDYIEGGLFDIGRRKRKQKQSEGLDKKMKEDDVKEVSLNDSEFEVGVLGPVSITEDLDNSNFSASQDDIEGIIQRKDPFALVKVEDLGKAFSESLIEQSETGTSLNEPGLELPETLKSEVASCDIFNEDSLSSSQEQFKAKPPVVKMPTKKDPKLTPMNSIQETEFLNKLNSCPNAIAADPAAKRLQRKLKLRKLKLEMGLPLFNIDSVVRKMIQKTAPDGIEATFTDTLGRELPKPAKEGMNQTQSQCTSLHHPALQGVNVLDRFRLGFRKTPRHRSSSSISQTFISRLVGRNDERYQRPIGSPYTQRVLKPYIRRDFDTKPLKLKVMEELIAYTHRFDQHWISPCPSPIDYCYVQPHHIPAVNAMCEEFFWAGINLSECLQYPDFSCVVLYRKLVIGFAFMVPDVKYNEAYISFILVHPDWRNAGIGTFMIYHLIQTCMGKDVTLHVSASNPSMMLYQKFGFKAEEFILDFYDKYLPEDSKDCKHAFFLRLQR
ncbi:cysteine-rich protein 2-binding protein-like [Rhopilema esculentum]|uniref:cysteine-rich protein 2-binding protein-like n=1 Tax=Rhopilema esculentum TaxID=499914 RepID=UPI0031E306A1|eukprot:gene4716-21011_t